jgi:hypothetical protein
VAQVEAKNLIGYSEASEANTGYGEVRTEPLAPTDLVFRIEDGTSDTQIRAGILTSVSDGASPILYFELWFDQGIEDWINIA